MPMRTNHFIFTLKCNFTLDIFYMDCTFLWTKILTDINSSKLQNKGKENINTQHETNRDYSG